MKLLHPFMPFITEEIFLQLSGEETIMLSSWPARNTEHVYEAECGYMESVMELVRSIRNIRAEMKVAPGQRIDMRLIVPAGQKAAYESMAAYFIRLAGAENVTVTEERGDIPKGDIHIVCQRAEAVIPLSSMVDIEKEKARIQKEMDRLAGDITRSESKLGSSGFIAKAPEKVVEEEKRKLASAREMLAKLKERREALA